MSDNSSIANELREEFKTLKKEFESIKYGQLNWEEYKSSLTEVLTKVITKHFKDKEMVEAINTLKNTVMLSAGICLFITLVFLMWLAK